MRAQAKKTAPLGGLFPLGRIAATPGALELLKELKVEPRTLLGRHWRGDWGQIDPEDKGINERAIKNGDRILSVYKLDARRNDTTVWIITESDRSVTTLLLPEDY